MTIQTVTDAIRYVGVDDNTLALFENQYPVQPMGVSYNSYVILDEKIAVMDIPCCICFRNLAGVHPFT